MLALTIAFRTPLRDSEAVCLYCGNDAAEALRIADSKPPGFHSAKVIKNPGWAKQRVYGRENAELPLAGAPEEVPGLEPEEKTQLLLAGAPEEAPGLEPEEAPAPLTLVADAESEDGVVSGDDLPPKKRK